MRLPNGGATTSTTKKMQNSTTIQLDRRAARAALQRHANRPARSRFSTWVEENAETLADWIRCLLWAAPRAALWAAILYGALSWFLAALEEERAAGLTAQANQEEAMQAWRDRVTEQRRAAVAALREREEARRRER